MIKLRKIKIKKYKCYSEEQEFIIDDKITILVGVNESGKTALLQAIAKTNYFMNDKEFLFNVDYDYPRKEKKAYQKSGQIEKPITCYYELSDILITKINEDLGSNFYTQKEVIYSKDYNNEGFFLNDLEIDIKKFIELKLKDIKNTLNEEILNELYDCRKKDVFNKIIGKISDQEIKNKISNLSKYFDNSWNWDNPVEEYIARVWIDKNLPKYLYYSEYYELPSRISINDINNNRLDEESQKTAKALLELADIDTIKITSSINFESFISELEATSSIISQQLFKYWSTNKNLKVRFVIDKIKDKNNSNIIDNIIDIRIENLNYDITLPLKNRSKGFNWFFSFIVWFSKIQEDKNSNYIILLDEPGLNLHASAQADLLKFFEDLGNNYQLLYTTHSPFMIESNNLTRVRTILETDKGTKISDAIQEKDPNTLFPLQAALGYDIAQNLFISKNNLLIEGPADLIYLTLMSNILSTIGKIGLNEEITLVPIGGLDKVSTFISLLRGSKLNIACLLDSPDSSSKQKIDNMIKYKIINENKIIYFDIFRKDDGYLKADIEDVFEKEDYLKIYNDTFNPNIININELDSSIKNILTQINIKLNVNHFNHFKPAYKLAQLAPNKDYFNSKSIERFEKIFIKINSLFK